ncbi:MAG: amino acid transporter [Candidatus Solibacter usitatus]|nr:amino acid transporter [Candidatus Solibacter usitatus]
MPASLWKRWLLGGESLDSRTTSGEHSHPWYLVIWLTGVDYFSTLGYQPGIALLAAGALSPIATALLVAVTLTCALPVYNQVAGRSYVGQGSIAMLENLLPGWWGRLLVLVLLGFAATDFVITMTLSAADAATHATHNPYLHPLVGDANLSLTLILLALLAAVFLKGFEEAITLATAVCIPYLLLNVVVLARTLYEVLMHPVLIPHWREALFRQGDWTQLTIAAALLFPRLALGLSGFETGVSVMPLIEGEPSDAEQPKPHGRIGNTRKLLLTAAVIMSVLLMVSSFVATLLIPQEAYREGGEASGRAIAYLAHRYLGNLFGSVYDMSTILILWFAGASAMAGLLNLVPKYLPRYGMAPEWARGSRPLVLAFTSINFLVTILFAADVDAQGGAYATGVLVLMTSAAVAVTLAIPRGLLRAAFFLVSAVFVYTTVLNVVERPEGIKIASFFIGITVAASLTSRALRATELRVSHVVLDEKAQAILESDEDQLIRILAHRPSDHSMEEYEAKDRISREAHHLLPDEQLIFLEILSTDASDFDAPLHVTGATVGPHKILRASSPAIPNAVAALLIHIAKTTGKLPHAYFGWTEGNPVAYLFRYLFLGEGDVAPITREVLRKRIPDPRKRPLIHVT